MRLCFLQKIEGPCEGTKEGYCRGACEHKENPAEYNKRVKIACAQLLNRPSYAIVDKGLKGNEKSCILVEAGHFYGMGYIPKNQNIKDTEKLKLLLTQYRSNSFIQRTIEEYATTYPEKVISLSPPH
jgi:DNA polymerase-3 subunit epsilon